MIRVFFGAGCQTAAFVLWILMEADIAVPSDWRKPMIESTAEARKPLTSEDGRGIMLLADEPVK